ncbi:hypothetical protein HanRHA438_Chr17g0839961 [Helianthus annuus]|nr:hypothetical protein HanRHA438_Chr17g0839961 [Helianthus annuus]
MMMDGSMMMAGSSRIFEGGKKLATMRGVFLILAEYKYVSNRDFMTDHKEGGGKFGVWADNRQGGLGRFGVTYRFPQHPHNSTIRKFAHTITSVQGRTQAHFKMGGRTPGEKKLGLNSVENPVRTPWNFSSTPLGIFDRTL